MLYFFPKSLFNTDCGNVYVHIIWQKVFQSKLITCKLTNIVNLLIWERELKYVFSSKFVFQS